jgi:carbonic anhydrase
MVNETFVQRLEKFQQYRKEKYLCNKDQHKALVNNPPKTDALIITCSDPRVVPSLTFLSEPGDEIVDQSVGNVFTENTAVALRTGILVRDVNLVLIMGHSDCLAMKCCLQPESADPNLGICDWLQQHSEWAWSEARELNEKQRRTKRALKEITQRNIIEQTNKAFNCLMNLARQIGRPKIASDTLIVGLYYDLATAQLYVCNHESAGPEAWQPADRVLKELRK